ncbi:hypothetical protein C1X24_27020, partial [Pseudomonas sp. FW305-124]|uniref:hypothetical protein n=1 Tax=Pseudomonas sp. FW305-124 TaxID=2070649 RepID=UPI000CC18579
LARDAGTSVCQSHRSAAIAGKPAPTQAAHISKKNMKLYFYYFQDLKTRFIIAPKAKTRFAL